MIKPVSAVQQVQDRKQQVVYQQPKPKSFDKEFEQVMAEQRRLLNSLR